MTTSHNIFKKELTKFFFNMVSTFLRGFYDMPGLYLGNDGGFAISKCIPTLRFPLRLPGATQRVKSRAKTGHYSFVASPVLFVSVF